MRVEDLQAYEVLEKRFIKDVDSEAYVCRHKKTGAKVALLSNEDNNKVFCIGFRTTPTDSTGVPHILEHSVLCGSENFPLKDPFVELVKGSLNTFLNAMTYPDKTVYPVASCNDKDFQNLMHVYLDAVFYPNIYKNEAIFRQEGWHYELDDEGKLTINGVVYNEMKGAFSSAESVLWREIPANLYPHTTYGVESGGDPEVIPELTYEQFLEFHRTYYHPSNSYIYLYGDMDMAEKLDYIDREYLSKFDAMQVNSEVTEEPAFEEPVRVVKEVPISEGESAIDNTYLVQAFSVGSVLDQELTTTLRVLDFVLGTVPGAPIRQALIEKGIGADVYSVVETTGIKQPFFGFVAKGAEVSQEAEFLQAVREVLEGIVEKGFDEKQLLSAINHFDFRDREADYGTTPKGLILGLSMFDSWLYDDTKPFLAIERLDTYEFLRSQIGTGYFEEIVRKYLLNNSHSVTLILDPKEGLTAKKEALLAQKLAKIKDNMSERELAEVKEMMDRLTAFRETEDSPEDIARIPLLTREDLTRQAPKIYNRETMLGDTFALQHNVFTNGIGYFRLIFKIEQIPGELIPYIGFLRGLYMNMNTEKYSYGELCNEVNLATGEIFVTQNTYGKVYDCDQYAMTMEFCTKAFYDKLPKAIELMEEMILRTDLTDTKRLKELSLEGLSKQRDSMNQAGHVVAINRALSYGSKKDTLDELMSGVDFYRFCCDLDSNFEERKTDLVEKLQRLCKMIYRPENLWIDFTGETGELEKLQDVIHCFKAKLYTEPVERGSFDPVLERKNEGLTTSGQVDYVCRAGNFLKKGLPYTGALTVLRVMMGYEYLWMNIRVKGGAYGCMCNFYKDGGSYFCSYRDPNLGETVDVFEKAAEFLANYQADERTMTKYIIGAMSELDTPLTANGVGMCSRNMYISGITQEDIQKYRDQVLDATPEDIRALSAYVEAFMSDEFLCVVGNEQKIKSESEKFFKIGNLC